MVKYFKIIIVVVLCLNSINVVAQNKEKQIEILHLSIEENNLLSILDSIILHEKECSYYDCKLLFSITIRKAENNFFVSIASQTDSNILLGLIPYGYYYHQNHLFLVDGDQCEDIFSTCGEKKIFKYLDYNHPDFQPKKGEKTTIYSFYDDSFSQWNYWYINKKFVLKDKPTSCD